MFLLSNFILGSSLDPFPACSDSSELCVMIVHSKGLPVIPRDFSHSVSFDLHKSWNLSHSDLVRVTLSLHSDYG